MRSLASLRPVLPFLRSAATTCSLALFSTKPNPNFSNTSHSRLQQLVYEKSKVGFDKLDDALQVFDKMLLMKPLLPVINFAQLLAALVKMKEYSVAVSLFRKMRVESLSLIHI